MYENQIKKYIRELILIDDGNLREDKIIYEEERIYSDMYKYTVDKSAIVIAAFEDDIIGFIWAYKRNLHGHERYHISYFIVDGNYRNLGVGTKLLNCVYEMALENDICEIELMVRNTNKSAMEFYRRHDFDVEKIKLCKRVTR